MLDGPAGAIGRGAWAARVGGVLSSEGAARRGVLACLYSLFFVSRVDGPRPREVLGPWGDRRRIALIS